MTRTLAPFLNDTFLLAVPYLHRLKSLTLSGSSDNLLQLTGYLGSPDPFSRRYVSCTCSNHFPRSSDNLANISHMTSVNLSPGVGFLTRLQGPSVGFYMYGSHHHLLHPPILDSRISSPSTTEKWAIGYYDDSVGLKIEEPSPYQTLLMTDLRTLTLTNCIDLFFVLALDPNNNALNIVACPGLMTCSIYPERSGGVLYRRAVGDDEGTGCKRCKVIDHCSRLPTTHTSGEHTLAQVLRLACRKQVRRWTTAQIGRSSR